MPARRPHRPFPSRLVAPLALLACSLLTGCISYTVGQGAETAPKGERTSSSSISVVPGTLDDSLPTRRPSVDTEVRYGVGPRTDIGFRLATWSGFMATWKQQLTRADTSARPENRARTSIMLGGGILNMGEHAGLEATLISSGRWSQYGQLYGAIRAVQVIPITRTAIRDDPVVGASIGYLLGDRDYSIGPEIGVYYDRSVLGLNTNRVLVIPSIVVRREGVSGFRGIFGL
ncbi:MAG: hypothetical protein V4813_15635 [Gemmatimonadota bacterium]